MANWDIGAVNVVNAPAAGEVAATDKVLVTRNGRLMSGDMPDVEAGGISLLAFANGANITNGTTDASDALDRATAYCLANGVPLILPGATMAISRTWNIGDGTNTSRATVCGFRVITAGGGVSQGEFGPPVQLTRLLWIGATGTQNPSAATDLVNVSTSFVTMVKINGPIHSLTMGPMVFDCANKADVGIEYIHPYMSVFDRPVATR